MRFMASAFLGLALLLFGDVSWGQAPDQNQSTEQPPTPQTDEKKNAEREKLAKDLSRLFFEEILLRRCDDPTLRSAIALPQPKLILESTDDGKTIAKTRVGFMPMKKLAVDLEVKSPLKSSGETTLASLDGLPDGNDADLAISWFGGLWKLKNGQEQEWKAIYDKLTELAERKKTAEGMESRWDIADHFNPDLSSPSAVSMIDPEVYKEAVKAYLEEIGTIPVFTARASYKQREFKFLTPVDGPPAGLKKSSESHTNYVFTVSGGAYFWKRFYTSLNYRWGTEYLDGGKQEFCAPTGAARILECTSHIVNPPKKGKPEALEFEIRGLAGDLGVGAHVTRDLEANVTIIELPVYLLQKLGTSKMELNLGARAIWRSDTQDVALSVFLGPAFSKVLRMRN